MPGTRYALAGFDRPCEASQPGTKRTRVESNKKSCPKPVSYRSMPRFPTRGSRAEFRTGASKAPGKSRISRNTGAISEAQCAMKRHRRSRSLFRNREYWRCCVTAQNGFAKVHQWLRFPATRSLAQATLRKRRPSGAAFSFAPFSLAPCLPSAIPPATPTPRTYIHPS